MKLQPIDKITFILMFVLSFVIGGLVWGVEGKAPRVSNFSWQNRQVGAEDTSFLLTFSRPMDRASVEENLQIDPPVPGKFSWAGRKMAYTLESPIPYGTDYEVRLEGAKEQFPQQSKQAQEKSIETFEGKFSTRDRALAYIGVGKEEGQLIVWNLTKKKREILTPPHLVVSNFEPYFQGDKILFTAATRKDLGKNLQTEKLYTVSTGINTETSNSTAPIQLILDSKEYQNLKFDLSQNGENIVVQRLNRENPLDFGYWLVKPGKPPQRLNQPPGGDFLIAPDSESMAITQGEGIAIVPLEADAEVEPLNFLPKYGNILSFSRDGSAAAMVNFNTNDPELRYTQSLFFVNNQGEQKKLLTIPGSVRSCEFDPTLTNLYCILAQRLEGIEEYQEQPFLAAIDLKSGKTFPLALLPNQFDIAMNMSSDGLGLLLDQVIVDPNASNPGLMTTSAGETIVDGKLWLLVTSPEASAESLSGELEALPVKGVKPRWLP